MMLSTIILSGAALLTTGTHAWTKDAKGVWVANNTYYTIRGSTVHEACTTMNTQDVHADGAFCAYWTDGVGDQFKGKCKHSGTSVLCI